MRTYTVQRGDTLYGISKQFGVSVSEIKRLNNLTSDAITVGDVLQIPTTGNTTYTVQRGDSLYSIARLYNTTVDAIKQFNGLTSDLLSIGMVLQIPALDGNDSSGYVNYTVKKGILCIVLPNRLIRRFLKLCRSTIYRRQYSVLGKF